MSETSYTVNHWGSHPEEENDDCYTGEDFDSKDDAMRAFNTDASFEVAYIEIDGPDINQVRKNPRYSKREIRLNDSAERSERAMQSGMVFGCQGYNEEMGYD